MISDRDRAAIEASVAAVPVEEWAPLDSTERDLLRRALREQLRVLDDPDPEAA